MQIYFISPPQTAGHVAAKQHVPVAASRAAFVAGGWLCSFALYFFCRPRGCAGTGANVSHCVVKYVSGAEDARWSAAPAMRKPRNRFHPNICLYSGKVLKLLSMHHILILFAHPRFELSKANRALLQQVPEMPGITLHDLYEAYPDFNIDIQYEQELLKAHQVIIWHHPFYWYSCPPLLKQWIDLVLEYGWCYGPGGTALQDKLVFNAITSGGTREVYQPEGRNRYTVNEFLRPFEQTARLCQMHYLPPFAVQGTHRLGHEELQAIAGDYHLLLKRLQHPKGLPSAGQLQAYSYLNDWLAALSEPSRQQTRED